MGTFKKIGLTLVTPLIRGTRKLNVFKRLSIFFLLLIILPTSVLTILTYNTYSSEMEKSASTLLSYTTHNVAQSITKQLQYYENLAYNLYLDESLVQLLMAHRYATTPAEADALKAKIEHRLYSYTSLSDARVFNLQIVSATEQFTQRSLSAQTKGGYLKDLNKFLAMPYYSDAVFYKGHPIWFDTTLEDDLFYRRSESARPITDTLSLMQSIPNYYLQDSVGVIIFNIYLKGILENLHITQINQPGHLLLISPKGTLASINAKIKGPTPKDVPQLLAEINDQLEGVFSTDINGSQCLVSFQKLDNSELYLVNMAYLDVLLQNARGIRRFTIIMMCLLIVIALLLSYIATLSITIPLNKLTKAFGILPTSGFSTTLEDDASDELGIVAQHFNHMVIEMKNLIHKVYLGKIRTNQLAFKKKEAELNALQMQINPHFLYNTLDIIRWEVIALEEGQGKVSQMIESFSSFLRLSIPKHSELVPITEEIYHITSYIDIINYRFEYKVDLITTLDDDLKNYYIPKLTLQPIIENCMVHAFAKGTPGKIITISGTCKPDALLLNITDNGKGMTSETQQKLNQLFDNIKDFQSDSIGLANVCERIHLYFGSEYSISVLDTSYNGTTIQLRLPCLTTPTKRGNLDV